MKGAENPDIMTDSQLWDRWFPFTIDQKESWKFFFELTWVRPRDFVRLLRLMKLQCRDKEHFTRESYDHAIREYSQSALSEISEEISTLFDDKTMQKIKNIIQPLGINFNYSIFIEEARKRGVITPTLTVDEMYRVGFIGNHYRNPAGYSRWRFFYRGDTLLDRSKPLEVHRALHDALGIKNTFSPGVFYS